MPIKIRSNWSLYAAKRSFEGEGTAVGEGSRLCRPSADTCSELERGRRGRLPVIKSNGVTGSLGQAMHQLESDYAPCLACCGLTVSIVAAMMG